MEKVQENLDNFHRNSGMIPDKQERKKKRKKRKEKCV